MGFIKKNEKTLDKSQKSGIINIETKERGSFK